MDVHNVQAAHNIIYCIEKVMGLKHCNETLINHHYQFKDWRLFTIAPLPEIYNYLSNDNCYFATNIIYRYIFFAISPLTINSAFTQSFRQQQLPLLINCIMMITLQCVNLWFNWFTESFEVPIQLALHDAKYGITSIVDA